VTPAGDLPIGRFDRDAALCRQVREGGVPLARVYPWTGTTIVLGRGSDPAVELRLDTVTADGVEVLRRPGGGCAVLLDPGNVVVAVALPVAGLGGITSHFRWISEWLCRELAEIGIPGVRQEGVSDLVLADRKIAGSCMHRAKDLLYYSATLLADADVGAIERYLAHPPREPDYRRGRPHAEFVRPLDVHPGGWTADRLRAALAPRIEPERLRAFPRPA
jgi:lipoate-protein ligase A